VRIASRFSIAVHILTLLGSGGFGSNTSEEMADSIGVNPVIVRRITGMLKRAGIVSAQQGVAGTRLARPISRITLLDVHLAVEGQGELFAAHLHPNPNCPVGIGIQSVLDNVFVDARRAMEAKLAEKTIANLLDEMHIKPSPEVLALE